MNKQFKVGEYISIYTNGDEDNFAWGNILTYDNDYIIIYTLDPSGVESGLSLYSICEIHKIEKNGKYHKKILNLMSYKKTVLNDYEFNKEKNLIKRLLDLALASQKTVSIKLHNTDVCSLVGLVNTLGDEYCSVCLLNQYGELDGEAICKLDNITSIHYDDVEDRDLLILKNINHN